MRVPLRIFELANTSSIARGIALKRVRCLVWILKGIKDRSSCLKVETKKWYANVPHTKLAEVKGHQNWMKVKWEFLTFPDGSTLLDCS
ncbi:hypothetical protein Scep_026586 [Stephania cephalantha]|uniref:Methyltransferase n=1 Tax=Stephania cephalantha TaxID=152367 RepID=A0AAP0EQR1_9MAGN